MAAPKIIVLGSLNGQLGPAFKKLATLHAKNDFALALLTGDVFAPTADDADDELVTALLTGALEVPLPTYFTVGAHPLPPRIAAKAEADGEICPNLHFLGKRSITKTSDGIRIVCLGGPLLDPNAAQGQPEEGPLLGHTDGDAKALRGANSADILLTWMWPVGVWAGSSVALEPAQQASIQSSRSTAELCTALRPRYHLSASPGDFFYEREPFLHADSGGSDAAAMSATRFISMAPYGNAAKAKAMYAFALSASDTSPPPGATRSPFGPASGNKREREDQGFSRFGGHGDRHHRGRHGKRRRTSPPPGPDRCYFCLSNPNVSAHMCCSIGNDAYVTTAKGPLPTPTTFADQGLDFPGHFIIIPLPHAATIPGLGPTSDPDGEAARTHGEMTRFREALQAMISARSAHRLGAVSWEISRDGNVHLIWQLVALPADLIRRGLAEAAFRVEAENERYPALERRELPVGEQAAFGDFFRVWLWADNGEDRIKGTSLVMPLPPDVRFNLQFARRVLAKLLGLEARFAWQDCVQSEEEETRDVDAFRAAFKDWDFTL